jgi:predicted O-methyltransferase YrrM
MNVKPFMCDASIKRYEELIFEGAKILELGAGNSTIWLAKRQVCVEAYEHDVDWFLFTEKAVKMYDNDDIHVHFDEQYFSAISTYSPETFDIIVVDGINRFECVKAIYDSNILKHGGVLLLDDCERRFISEEYKSCFDTLKNWNKEFVSDYPFISESEFEKLKETVRPHKLKQTLFAFRP